MGGDREISSGEGGGGSGLDVSPGPKSNNEASGCSASAVSEPSSRMQGSDSMGPASAAENGDQSCESGNGDQKTSTETETGQIPVISGSDSNDGGGGRIRKIPPQSGVRVKFIVESLRMEMIQLQQQNAKLRRIVATRLPDRSDGIFDACCSVSASKAVAARESFVKKMAEALANLGVGIGDDDHDDDDDDDDEEEEEEAIHVM